MGPVGRRCERPQRRGFCLWDGNPAWFDAPGIYHNGGCGFAFADGHSETHRWRERFPEKTAEEPPSWIPLDKQDWELDATTNFGAALARQASQEHREEPSLRGGLLWQRRIGPDDRAGTGRHGILDNGRRAPAAFGDELEMRFERGIFSVLGLQMGRGTLNDRNDTFQFVRHHRGDVACRVKFPAVSCNAPASPADSAIIL